MMPSGDTPADNTMSQSEQAVARELKRDHGVSRLLNMSAVASIDRNLEAEDAAVERNIRDHERQLFGGDQGGSEGDDDVQSKIMVAGDYAPTINQPQKPQNGWAKLLGAGLLGAGLVGGGAGLGSLLNGGDKPAPVVHTDADNVTDFTPTLEPIERTNDAKTRDDNPG